MASQIDKFFTKKDAQEYLENNGLVADISVLKAPDKEGRLWKISNIRPKLEVPEVGTDAFNFIPTRSACAKSAKPPAYPRR